MAAAGDVERGGTSESSFFFLLPQATLRKRTRSDRYASVCIGRGVQVAGVGEGDSHMRITGNLTDFNCNTISSSAETRRTRPPTCDCEGREMRSGAGDGEQGRAKWLPVQMETLWGFWNLCVSVCVCVWRAHART